MVKGINTGYTKEQALDRVYEVKKMGTHGGCIFLPKCLRGIKVKLKEFGQT